MRLFFVIMVSIAKSPITYEHDGQHEVAETVEDSGPRDRGCRRTATACRPAAASRAGRRRQRQQQDPDDVPGKGVPDEDRRGADVVEKTLVPQGLCDAQRDGDEVGQDQGDEAEVQRDGDALP